MNAHRILWLPLFCAAGTFAHAQDSYRSPLFDNWKEKGELQELKSVKKEGYTLTLWAQKGRYDVSAYRQEKIADPAKFYDDVLEVCDWVIRNSAAHLKGPLNIYHVVLLDGFVKGGTSGTVRGTNAFCAEIRKWHERMYSRKSRKDILYLSAAHEEYHLQNYKTDAAETKFMRELSAMVWESTTLIKRAGKVSRLWGGMNSNKKQVKQANVDIDQDFTEKYNSVLTRGLAYWIANILYRHAKTEGIESFSRNLLNDKRQGIESFDALAKEKGILVKGSPITIKQMIREYRAYLKR